MKKTQFIELFKNIRTTFVTFISISLFVAMGVSAYLGLTWTGKALEKTVNDYYKKSNYYDVQINYPYGISTDLINDLKKDNDIDNVEGTNIFYNYFFKDEKRYEAQINLLTEDINIPSQLEGKIPTNVGEIAILKKWAQLNNFKIGDTIEFQRNDQNFLPFIDILKRKDKDALKEIDFNTNVLKTNKFIITGLLETPNYLSLIEDTYGINDHSTNINCILYISKNSINEKALSGYNSIYLSFKSLNDLNIYSKEYDEKLDLIITNIKEISKQYGLNTSNLIINNANELKIEIENDIKDGEEKIIKSEKDIKKSQKELVDAKKELEDKQIEIDNGYTELNKAKDQINNATCELNSSRQEINEYKKALSDLSTTINKTLSTDIVKESAESGFLKKIYEFIHNYEDIDDDTLSKIDTIYDKALNITEETLQSFKDDCNEIISSVESYIVEYENEINDGANKINKAKNDIKQNEEYLISSQKKIDDGWKEYRNGQKKLRQAKKDLEQAKVDLEENKTQFEEYKDNIKDIEVLEAYATLAKDNSGYIAIKYIMEIFRKLKYSIAGLFVIVGLLVCYSAISRLVYEQVSLIGTKKALGFYKKEITTSYLIYTSLGCVIGSIVGFIVSRYGIETILMRSISETYTYETIRYYSSFSDFTLFALFEFAIQLSVTYFACTRVLRKSALKLLQGLKEPTGKKHFFEDLGLYKRLSLLGKTIINNSINDKRRVFATVVGIAGCTALVVCAISLRDFLLNSFDRQYSKVYSFNNIVYFEVDKKDSIEKILIDNDIEYNEMLSTTVYLKTPNNTTLPCSLFITDNNDYNGLIKMYDKNDNKSLLKDGMWLSYSYYNTYGDRYADSLNIIDQSGNELTIKADGFFEYYLLDCQGLLSKKVYEQYFNNKYESNSFLVKNENISYDDFYKMLSKEDGFINMRDYYTETKYSFDVISGIFTIVVGVYLVLAILMALLVLLNLFIMFVEEKKREIIILIINGYDRKKAKQYIYSDTIFLTIIGVVLGLLLGIVMGNISLDAYKNDTMFFMSGIDIAGCVIGVFFTIVLTFVTSFISLKKVDRFVLSDINKA